MLVGDAWCVDVYRMGVVTCPTNAIGIFKEFTT